MSIMARMSEAVEALLASLSDHQRAAATAPFDVGDHRRWTYLPGPRPGLSFADMSGKQRALALPMLDAGCSEAGARTARAVIELDMIRRRLSAAPDRQPDPTDHRYWVRILGAPGGGTAWGWRVNGHHLAVHVTVYRDKSMASPAATPPGSWPVLPPSDVALAACERAWRPEIMQKQWVGRRGRTGSCRRTGPSCGWTGW